MSKTYTREQLRDLYIKLPQEVKEMASSDATTENIENICKRAGFTDERVGQISDLIRDVLYGVLPPGDFPEALKKEVKLKKGSEKDLIHEINRFIFYPVKTDLVHMYNIETVGIEPQEKKVLSPSGGEVPIEEKIPETPQPTGPDTYREPIE